MSGRTRDQALDLAITAGAGELLARRGYRHFSIEAVAHLAGVPKSTVYRRWSSRTALAVAVLSFWLEGVSSPPPGGWPHDVRELLSALIRTELAIASRHEGRAVVQLVLAHLDDADSETEPLLQAVRGRRDDAAALLRAAAADGRLPADVDVDLVLDLTLGAVWASVLTLRSVNDHSVDAIVDVVLSGIGQPPPS